MLMNSTAPAEPETAPAEPGIYRGACQGKGWKQLNGDQETQGIKKMGNQAKKAHTKGCAALYKRDFETAARAFALAVSLDPENPLYLGSAALTASRLGNFAESERLYKCSIEEAKNVFGPDDPQVATVTFGLVDLYRNKGRYQDAEALCHDMLVRLVDTPFGTMRARVMSRLGDLNRQQGRFEDAEVQFLRAIAECETAYGAGHPKVAGQLRPLAELYRTKGQKAEAEAVTRRATEIMSAARGASAGAAAA